MIDTADALTAFAGSIAHAPALSLDTEFMREKTYRAQLCLVQIAGSAGPACIDPLALDLAPLAGVLTSSATCKVMHAARQDLEVLLPAVGLVRPVFDTQVAASLAGFPAQIGYAELARRLLGVELAKAHTRTDWARRPLSADQQEYALDDVRHLLDMRAKLLEMLEAKGRIAWLEEELAGLANPDALQVVPEEAWKKVKALPTLDPARQRLAQEIAAWRERRAIDRNRPRGWILDDVTLREIVLRVPRTVAELSALPDIQDAVVRKCGEDLLALVRAAGIPNPPPPLPRRERPDPAQLATVKRLADIAGGVANELEIGQEVLATRRELERLAAGKQDVSLLRGWRADVLGKKLLSAL